MKTLFKITQTLSIALIICFSSNAEAQTKSTKKDTVKAKKKDNLLDMQANVLTDIFGSNLDGKRDEKKLNYLQLLEKSGLTEAQKKEYRNWYYLQSKNLTQKQKDSLGNAMRKKILETKKTNN